MITDCFDDKTEPVISLRDFYGEQKHLIETCLILFSQKIYQHLLDTFPSEKIGLIGACNGNIPIYRMNYKGKDIAFYLSGIGSAIAASECYEASWIVGASKFVMFGSCGSLNREATRGKFIVPPARPRGAGRPPPPPGELPRRGLLVLFRCAVRLHHGRERAEALGHLYRAGRPARDGAGLDDGRHDPRDRGPRRAAKKRGLSRRGDGARRRAGGVQFLRLIAL